MAVEVKNIKFKRKLLLLCLYINKLFGKTENNSVLIKNQDYLSNTGGDTGIRPGSLLTRI